MSINASIEWLVTTIPFYGTTRVTWIDNILVPELRWGDRGIYKLWDLKPQSRPRFGGRSLPWRGDVPFRPDYLPSSPVNARATAHRVRDSHLQENSLAQAQTVSRDLHTGGDKRG